MDAVFNLFSGAPLHAGLIEQALPLAAAINA
jgi:hypothetical protein